MGESLKVQAWFQKIPGRVNKLALGSQKIEQFAPETAGRHTEVFDFFAPNRATSDSDSPIVLPAKQVAL